MDRLPGVVDLGEIDHPVEFRVKRTTDMNLDPERMAVQSGAWVTLGQSWQTPRRLDGVNVEDIHSSDSMFLLTPIMDILRMRTKKGLHHY